MRVARAAHTAAAVLLTVTTAIVVPPPGAASAVINPDAAQQLANTANLLQAASLLPELTNAVPGLYTSPSELLGLHDIFSDLASINPAADIEQQIDALDGDGVTFSNVSAGGSPLSLTFDLAVDKSVTVPLAVVEGDAQVVGGDIEAHVVLPATTLSFEYDAGIGAPADNFAIVDLPTLPFAITVDVDDVSVPLQFGFADATATGSFNLATDINVTLVDPDGSGRLTASEVLSSAIADLVDLSFPAGLTPDLDVALTLTADVAGTQFSGTLTLTDQNLFADPAPAIDLQTAGPNPIDLLANLGPDLVATSLAQLLSSFGAGMLAGDVRLPFLGDGVFLPGDLQDGFDQVFAVVQPLYDYITPRAAGQIVCGPNLSTPADASEDGIPAGPIKGLHTGDVVHCRAYTSVDGGSVSWSVTSANASVTSNGTSADTIGADPTRNATFTMTADGDLDVAVTYTPSGESEPVEVLPRAETIQELIGELFDAGILPSDTVSWNPTLQAFEFEIATNVADPPARAASLNAGDELVAGTGITGLSGSAAATASVDLGSVDAGVTFGLIATDDEATINPADNELPGAPGPGPSDRFYLRTDGPVLAVDDVDIAGNLAMVGRLGFLEVDVTATGSLGKPDAAAPALAVSIIDPGGVTVGGGSDPTAILVRDLLTDPASHIDGDVNLALAGSIAVSASAGGLASASGSATIAWDLDDPSPTVNLDSNFTTSLSPFDQQQTFTYTGAGTDGTLFETTGVDFLSMPGIVGSSLVDADGVTCTVTAVVSATSLRCNDDTGTNPITFTNGTTYDLKGNTLSHLVEILDAIEQFATYLEGALGEDAFNQPLDLVGIRPADVVSQIGALRQMVDEFRGIQDAQLQCEASPDDEVDIRALPVAGGDQDITCHAVAPGNDATGVEWRIADEDGNGTFASAPNGTVGPGTDTMTLSVAASLDDDGDGFVELGAEYRIEVRWTSGAGDQRAQLPPPTPGSLQQLDDAVTEVLGLPDSALEFVLEDAATDPTLRINLAFGICSEAAPSESATDCDGMPTGPAPTASLSFDLGGSLPEFIGLETDGVIGVRYAALGQFDIGVPLDGDEPVLYGTTGLEARLEVEGEDITVSANIGPAGFAVGTAAAGPTGAVEADSADTLQDDEADFVTAGIAAGATVTNTTTGEECFVSAVTDATHLTCAPASGWTTGNEYRIGGVSELHAAMAVSLDLGDASNTPVPDGDSVPISDATAVLPDLDTFFSGDAECGNIDAANSDQVVDDGNTGDDSTPLGGIACARFSLALTSGTAVAYIGEVGIDLDSDGLTVWVPSDLGTRLANAALNPAFLLHALPEILAEIEAGLRAAADSGVPDALADPLRAGADGVGEVQQLVADGIAAFESAVGSFSGNAGDLEGFLDTQLTNLLGDLATSVEVVTYCGDLDTECDDGESLLNIFGVEANVEFGQEVAADGAINLGLEGLPISVAAGVEASANWHIAFGFGVSRDDGPYIRLADGTEVGLEANVDLTGAGIDCPTFAESPLAASVDPGEYSEDVCIKARLGFLSVVARDSATNPSEIAADVGLDITRDGGGDVLTMGDIIGGRFDAEFQAAGSVNIDLHIRTGFEEQSADMPSLLGTLQFSWDVSIADGVGDPTFAFGDLHLDLGSFIASFIEPIAKEIRKITGPLQPIIDVITAPIPVVSDLSELAGGDPVTMISILEAATGADLSLVEAVAAFITFVNGLPSDVPTQIPLGGLINGLTDAPERNPGAFNVNVGKAASSVSPQDAGKLIDQGAGYVGGSGFVNDVAAETGMDAPGEQDGRPTTFGVPGLSFPFLEDASQLFGILVGRDAVLVRWDAGTMRASAGLSYDFGPIMVGPVPITISIGGEIGIEGRFAIGYDTSGIRKVLAGGSGTYLFDGIFIDDLDTNGVDVPEIRFFGRVFAGAKVDLVIISAGVRGGIELTFDLNLNDSPDPDGKLRIEEIISKLQNPICLFDVSGKIEAFLEAFVEIDLFFYSEEFSFELVRITLLEWSSACEPPSPVLAEPSGSVLYLNVGSRADRRNVAEDEPDDRIEVRQLGDGHVRVSGFGWEEEHTGVGLIVADLGAGDDELSFLEGQDPEYVDPTPNNPNDDAGHRFPFTIPTVVTGGPDSDVIKLGDGPDFTNGDAALSSGEWAGIAFTAPASQGGSDGEDTVNAGAGNDVTNGDGANDTLDGQFGNDTVRGGDADDELNGGGGDDAVLGGPGGDTIQGGPIEQPAPNETPDDDDALVGGTGTDTVTGDFGNDVVFGDDEAAGFFSGTQALSWSIPSRDTWAAWCPGGSSEFDLLTGNEGDDWIVGGGGNDQIDAGGGNDHACGGAGDDQVLGGTGDDEVRGDENNDLVVGDAGHDIAHGGSENDDVQGGPDGDDVFGGTGSDLVNGNDGDDIVVGDEATIAAGHPHGVDTAEGALDPAAVVAMSNAVTRSAGGAGARRADCTPGAAIGDSDCLFGGTGSDSMFGTGDGDIATGDSGADFIEGNGGDDDLKGGVQDDLLFGNEGGDLIAGDSGADQAYGDRSVADWQADDPNGFGVDTINGGPDADHLEGDGAGDTILGAGANDHIEGNDGDDALHGEAGNDDVIGGSDRATEPDGGETIMTGGTGTDVLVGDNGIIAAGGIVGGRIVTLLDPTIGGGDTIEGDADTDFAFGGPGADTIWGDQGTVAPVLGTSAADYIEGDDGDDTIRGEAGNDDLVGGGSAADGVIDADRVGNGLTDAGETLVSGGDGLDWIAGDNARMNRVLLSAPDYPNDGAPGFDPIVLFDVARTGGPAIGAGTSGADTLHGDGARDLVFGQGGNDTVHGDDGTDYLEGNIGDDTMFGGAADDDMVGGGSATDGVIDRVRVGTTLHDGGESLMSGGDGVDWMAGDNAFANRVLFADPVTPVTLFDVNSTDTAVSGGDTMNGDAGTDVMFGQGNGAQGNQSDPADGVDNDADGATDEDGAAWDGDILTGNGEADYIEGNHGSDLIIGSDGNDDLIGGGSAIDGVIDADRVGNGLTDARDTIHGEGGDDVASGDNARILPAASGVLWLSGARSVVLFDVNSANTALSGGDFIATGEGADVAFGQGNGSQPATAADPLNGIDDDLDGREGALSTEYDCGDGSDNDGDGNIDGADSGCTAATDEDSPWLGDLVLGGNGEDYLEGNHGADWLFAGDGQDIVTGGGSALDGVIDADRSGIGLLDGNDVIHGEGDHDVITGDNATVNPVKAGAAWALIPDATATFDLLQRTVAMAQSPEAAGRFGADHITGDTGHDQIYGQQGGDWIEGNEDDDAVIGDLGLIVPSVETGTRYQHIAPQQPFLEDDIFANGTLTYTTTLYSQVTGQGSEGNDIILGGQGHDDLHGGPGNDIMNGDRYAPPDPPDPDLIDMIPGQFVFDDPAIGLLPLADEDAVFGGYGDDVMWGGRGPDHLYGGHGRDFLDVRPRPNATPDFPVDPPGWFTWVALPGTQEHYQDSDVIYGGFDADALQANLADTGPSDGDRLLDWSGAFNIYYVCPPVYGDWVITRSIAPGILQYLNDLAAGDGLSQVTTAGSSGFLELGLVYTKDVKNNTNPHHPETPGHFYCGEGT